MRISGESRAQEHVGKDVDDGAEVRGAGARVVAGHLFRRKGVEVTANAFDLLGNLAGGALRRALEEHVLEEMEDAVLPARLLAAADTEPETDGDALDMRHVRDGELGSVLETFLAENHA
jgi:hypothetical protein